MAFVRTWLIPRVAFWVMWTAWLWWLQRFLPPQAGRAAYWTQLLVLGPPLLLTWLGSRLAKNPFDSRLSLFWKGASVSCLLAIFADVYLIKQLPGGFEALAVGFVASGYLGLRGGGRSKRIEVKYGELFDRVQAIARRSGVSVHRVQVFATPKNTPAAFAHRLGSILLSDGLLRILSRRETDAVIAHEAAHLRPTQRLAISCMPLLAGMTILLDSFWPGLRDSAPFWPFATVLLWRALRRVQEYSSDASAAQVTRDPEALITGLARVSQAAGLPLHWSPLAGIFIAHPPMSSRFRAIARRAGITSARVDELVATATATPALPGYGSPFGNLEAQSAASVSVTAPVLSAHFDRMELWMGALSKGWPLLAGAGIPILIRYRAFSLTESLALTAAWITAGVLVYWMSYELIVGTERRRFRKQLRGGRDGDGFYAGLSTAAEPRYFEGSYHYDLGIVKLDGGSLNFIGARCCFSLRTSQVLRIWIACGPRHWTPRKIVCIEYQFDDTAQPAVVSLQSLESWFWPATTIAANRLLLALTKWRENAAPAPTPVVAPPQAQGGVLPEVTFAQAWKAIRILCLISLCVGWVIGTLSLIEPAGIFLMFAPPVVTAALLLFGIAPHLKWTSPRHATLNPAQPPPLPEPEQ